MVLSRSCRPHSVARHVLQGQLPGASANSLGPLELPRGSVGNHGVQVQLRLRHQRALVLLRAEAAAVEEAVLGDAHGLHKVREVDLAGDDGGPRVELAADPLLHPASVPLGSAILPRALGVCGVNEDAPLFTAASKAALELAATVGDHQLGGSEGGHPALVEGLPGGLGADVGEHPALV
eukprot:6875209-Alexandrium_andersonii.AAC.1